MDSFRLNTATFSQFARDAVYPYGSGGRPNGSFALLTVHYMRTYGAEAADFGKLAWLSAGERAAQSAALFQEAAHAGRISERPLIADPLRLFDCVMPCAGAEPSW